jgi:hypothetical protein
MTVKKAGSIPCRRKLGNFEDESNQKFKTSITSAVASQLLSEKSPDPLPSALPKLTPRLNEEEE